MTLSVGDTLPADVVFSYVPYTAETPESLLACATPVTYNALENWKDKKVVLIGMPGAFTPGCSERHLPPLIESVQQIRDKNVDIIAVLSVNDAFVLDAWRKANGVRNEIIFLSDPGLKFSHQLGWVSGDRPMRYAIILENNKIVSAEVDEKGKIERSSAQSVLSKL